jgi:hypothetical protein
MSRASACASRRAPSSATRRSKPRATEANLEAKVWLLRSKREPLPSRLLEHPPSERSCRRFAQVPVFSPFWRLSKQFARPLRESRQWPRCPAGRPATRPRDKWGHVTASVTRAVARGHRVTLVIAGDGVTSSGVQLDQLAGVQLEFARTDLSSWLGAAGPSSWIPAGFLWEFRLELVASCDPPGGLVAFRDCETPYRKGLAKGFRYPFGKGSGKGFANRYRYGNGNGISRALPMTRTRLSPADVAAHVRC